jgi:hypothetical protein
VFTTCSLSAKAIVSALAKAIGGALAKAIGGYRRAALARARGAAQGRSGRNHAGLRAGARGRPGRGARGSSRAEASRARRSMYEDDARFRTIFLRINTGATPIQASPKARAGRGEGMHVRGRRARLRRRALPGPARAFLANGRKFATQTHQRVMPAASAGDGALLEQLRAVARDSAELVSGCRARPAGARLQLMLRASTDKALTLCGGPVLASRLA